jgi:ATP-dependent DNA helicase RecQ
MHFSQHFSTLFFNTTQRLQAEKANQIFVLQGQSSLLITEAVKELLADPDTFLLEKDDSVFNQVWFAKVFPELLKPKEYHLLSYAQFSYLIQYLDPSFFAERLVILRDNLRQLYPIAAEDYLEKEDREDIGLRPENLPVYQAEQVCIDGKYYYSVKTPSVDFKTHDLFTESKELSNSTNAEIEVIDVSSDSYALDVFVNECIAGNDFSRSAAVKIYSKQPLSPVLLHSMKRLNHLLGQFGGRLLVFSEVSNLGGVQIKASTKDLLLKYWGATAKFKNISIYRNPNLNNDLTEVSQGHIVDTIINEYEMAKAGKNCRDLFLTAPTGAGKSLLFQLPAFHISGQGDVTIVVSPLIALMNDQVDAIRTDRRFEKVAYLNSELSLIDRDRIIESCKNKEIDILYMSPELLLSYDISHFIGSRKLGLMVIDEAHLITTWGRDFRVDYWFLGNHIRKIRKYGKYSFPMVAVTATAIFGGSNDMVFDSIDSLVMHDPHILVGEVKRKDIEFLINNHDAFTANYQSQKLNQTAYFIRKINELGLKTLVYAPYTRHIDQILAEVNRNSHRIATGYHGALDINSKKHAYEDFRDSRQKIMVSTKAFGMGVDIADIQVVYHHAPSGLLPDYVQEIGRAARRDDIQGFAALNYSSQDQRFTKALHGMSALRPYQLKEVLKKIHKTYLKNDRSRNLLLSVNDFGHIFDEARGLDQKVLTALMMLEKDYLAKNRFNVLIARPKKLFVKVYAHISEQHLLVMQRKYADTFQVVADAENGNKVIELDLDRYWYKHCPNKSFPLVKKAFYDDKLFQNDGISLTPQLKASFQRQGEFHAVYVQMQSFLESLKGILVRKRGFFSQIDLEKELFAVLQNQEKAEKLSKFILASYSGRLIQPGIIEPHAFLQQRRNKDGNYEYQVFGNQYLASFEAILRRLNNLFSKTEESVTEKFVTNKNSNTINYVRLGYFLEMLDLGTFEMKGGENPMVFIRINDPARIYRDSRDPNYSNTLLNKTLDRHTLSNRIFDHFFLRTFTNDERWNFIEDFFLGADGDDLLKKYPGGGPNNLDIIEELKKKELTLPEVSNSEDTDAKIHIFPPIPERFYTLKDLLTIVKDLKKETHRISDWLVKDPVLLHRILRESKIKLEKEILANLRSKLVAYHPDYFRDAMGLKKRIRFKGYDGLVQASVPYHNQPLEFYRWWSQNQDEVFLGLKEKVELFDKVNLNKPSLLKAEHKRLLSK